MAFIGASGGKTSGSSDSTSSQSGLFSGPQSEVQDQIGGNLSQDLAAANQGNLTAGVTARKTQSADAINAEADGLQGRMTRFLAQRGFGKSGQTGKVALQGELGRQAALGNNEASYSGQQDQLNQGNLLAALNYAFTQMGTTAAGHTASEGSGWGVNAGAGWAPSPSGSGGNK